MQTFAICMVVLLCRLSSLASVNISPCAKWNTAAKTVAGTTDVSGDAADQLNIPQGIFIEKQTNTLYIADYNNDRVQMYRLNQPSTNGTTVALQAYSALKLYVDDNNGKPIIYVALRSLNQVRKWTSDTPYGEQVVGDCETCAGVWVDNEGNVYMSESSQHAVLKWSPRTNTTEVIAGQRDQSGSSSDLFNDPQDIQVDPTSGTFYVADYRNNRIQMWLKNATTGITVAGSSKGDRGDDAVSLADPTGLWVDHDTGVVYVADTSNDRIQRWKPNATEGDTIAGGSGRGNASNQLNRPADVTFDSEGNLYVCDIWNHRVQMYAIIDNHPCSSSATVLSSMRKNNVMTIVLLIFLSIMVRLF